jgi:type I restriction enzyme S subunit
VREFDVLINSTGVGTLGRVAQVIEIANNYTVDSHVTIVRPDRSTDPVFFGVAMLRLESVFEALGVGSTGQTELQRERIRAQEVLRPSPSVQKAFGGIVGPMRKLGHLLGEQNANLRAQRDLLLPKLVSGEIDVSAAPLQQEAAE